jgi:hypothetical protein
MKECENYPKKMTEAQFNKEFGYAYNSSCDNCGHVERHQSREITGYKMGTDLPEGFYTKTTLSCEEKSKRGVYSNVLENGCCRLHTSNQH